MTIHSTPLFPGVRFSASAWVCIMEPDTFHYKDRLSVAQESVTKMGRVRQSAIQRSEMVQR